MSTIPSAASATENTVSNWAAPYVTDYLSKGQALANQPYQAYTGPLTAGQSGMQQQAFQGLANLAVPTSVTGAATSVGNIAGQMQGTAYNPSTFNTQTWNTQQAQQYMNPYLQTSLDPQLAESRRQADISRMNDSSRLAQAGAYGGSRQAIMESENRRNLMDTQGQITGRGYDTAYSQGMNQFNADQGRLLDTQRATESSRQFGASHDLSALGKAADTYQAQSQLGIAGLNAQRNVLGDQLQAGGVQRTIEQQGITADLDQFREERAYPYEMLQYQKDLISGMPISTSRSYTASGTDPLAAILTGAGAGGNLANLFQGTPKP
jgi:hypothetical protein